MVRRTQSTSYEHDSAARRAVTLRCNLCQRSFSFGGSLRELGLWQAPNFLDLSQLSRLLRVGHLCWLERQQAPESQGRQRLSDILGLIALHVRLVSDTDRSLSSFLPGDFVLGNFGCGADSFWGLVEDILNTATDADLLSATLKVLRSGTQLMDAERCACALEFILGRLKYEDLPKTRSSARYEVIATLVDALEASRAFSKLFIGDNCFTPRAQVQSFFAFPPCILSCCLYTPEPCSVS